MNSQKFKIFPVFSFLIAALLLTNPIFSQNQSFQRSNKITYQVSGVVFKAKNRKPIKDAKISTYKVIKEENTGEIIFLSDLSTTPTYYTSSDGGFSFELDADQEYLIEISAEGYQSRQYNMKKQSVNNGQKIAIEIPLNAGEPIQIEGVVFDLNTKNPIGNAIVELTDKQKKTTKSTITEKDGKFVFSIEYKVSYEILVQKNQYYEKKINFTKEQGEASFEEIFLEKVKTGEKIELETFLFSVNSAELIEENIDALKKIERTLKGNSNLVIEIGCHSDARGNDQYNLELSQKRANAIANYLIEKGIDTNRLVPKGYGETQIKNECANGIKCSNEKHEENRRVVITVIGVIE